MVLWQENPKFSSFVYRRTWKSHTQYINENCFTIGISILCSTRKLPRETKKTNYDTLSIQPPIHIFPRLEAILFLISLLCFLYLSGNLKFQIILGLTLGQKKDINWRIGKNPNKVWSFVHSNIPRLGTEFWQINPSNVNWNWVQGIQKSSVKSLWCFCGLKIIVKF